MNDIVQVNCGSFRAEYRLELYDINGNLLRDSGWFGNDIVNAGLTLMTASASWSSRTYVGDGAGATNPAQTQMNSLLDTSLNSISTSFYNPVFPDYQYGQTVKRRFEAGEGTGTIREVGVGQNDASTQLVSRAEVIPNFVKQSNQILDVSWRFLLYPNLTQQANDNVDIGGVLYDTVTLPYNVDASSKPVFTQFGPNTSIGNRVYDGTSLAAITDTEPPGNVLVGGTAAFGDEGAVANGYYRDLVVTHTVDQANLAGKIRTATVRTRTEHQIQTQYNSQVDGLGIPKTNQEELVLTWRYTWTRK